MSETASLKERIDELKSAHRSLLTHLRDVDEIEQCLSVREKRLCHAHCHRVATTLSIGKTYLFRAKEVLAATLSQIEEELIGLAEAAKGGAL